MKLITNNRPVSHTKKSFFIGFFAVGVIVLISVITLSSKTGATKIVNISEGSSITQAGSVLKDSNIIHSKLLFRVFAQFNNRSIKAGPYLFTEHEGLFRVIYRLSVADYGDVYERVTLPEGSTVVQMADILSKADLPHFSKNVFIEQAQHKEGYLFPDTYFFLPNYTTEDIIKILENTFENKIEKLDFSSSSRSQSDIIIMASIIQKEAGMSLEEKKMISGILWKRIDQGMLLQVDAPFLYALGKGSAQLSTRDLTNDHPYNTYKRKGLTPTPIANPGLDAIVAALQPTESLYFFYLHDTNGNIHYGETHADHVRNKQRYIN